MNTCADLAWSIFGLFLLIGTSLVGFAWPERPLQIASGFVILSTANMVAGQVLDHRVHLSGIVNLYSSIVYLVVLFSWVRVFRVPEREFTLKPPIQSKSSPETSSYA